MRSPALDELDLPSDYDRDEEEEERERRRRERERERQKKEQATAKTQQQQQQPGLLDEIEASIQSLSFETSPVESPAAPAASVSSALPAPAAARVVSPGGAALLLPGVSPAKHGASGTLLNPINCHGLRIDYTFLRTPSIYSNKMNAIQLTIRNESSSPIQDIEFTNYKVDSGQEMRPLEPIPELAPNAVFECYAHVNFNGKAQSVKFTVSTGAGRSYQAQITPGIGELIRPLPLSKEEFEEKQKRLSGMNENTLDMKCSDMTRTAQNVVAALNIAALAQHKPNVYRFSGEMLSNGGVVLIELAFPPDHDISAGPAAKARCTVNCEDLIFSGLLLTAVKQAIA